MYLSNFFLNINLKRKHNTVFNSNRGVKLTWVGVEGLRGSVE